MIPYSFNPLTHSHFVYVFLDSLSPRMNYILPKCPSLIKTSLATLKIRRFDYFSDFRLLVA